jgi:triacylglycerol esterase/lipase EstA (alpha/beta hydrolase family)
MLVTLVWLIVKVVTGVVVVTQFACFAIALYEMLNLPEMRLTRLTPTALAGALRGLVVEIAGAILAVLTIPLGALPFRAASADDGMDRPPIVFVPGYLMTRSSLWILHRRLARAGWRHGVGYNYRTLRGDLRAAARGLGALIDAVAVERGATHVVVVAHGMGGLVARLCLRERADARVRTLVTLGTPHQGSKLYALALDPMAQEMRAGSALIEDLAEGDQLTRKVDVTAIYSSFDLTVVPSSAGQYPGASNIEVEGVGHVALLWSLRVFELVRENLEFAHDTLAAEAATARRPSAGDQEPRSAATHRATSVASE